VNNEPCKRQSGSYRAHFPSREAAEKFAEEHEDYYGDLPRFCCKCHYWHLNRVEWVVPEWARKMTSVN
jgi:hypothetical protein